MIKRCAWCRDRIGDYSYFIGGQWLDAVDGHIPQVSDDDIFTDGICPECEKLMREKGTVKGEK